MIGLLTNWSRSVILFGIWRFVLFLESVVVFPAFRCFWLTPTSPSLLRDATINTEPTFAWVHRTALCKRPLSPSVERIISNDAKLLCSAFFLHARDQKKSRVDCAVVTLRFAVTARSRVDVFYVLPWFAIHRCVGTTPCRPQIASTVEHFSPGGRSSKIQRSRDGAVRVLSTSLNGVTQ